MPEIAFFADPGVKQSIRISSILTDLERERAKLADGAGSDRARAGRFEGAGER